PIRSCSRLPPLDCFGPALARTDPDHVLDCRDEDLPVADPAGARALHDRVDDLGDTVVRNEDRDLHLGQEIDDVFRAAIELGVTLLSPESLPLLHGHAVDAGLRENLLPLVELERLDDGVDALHRSPFIASLAIGRAGTATPMPLHPRVEDESRH